MMTARDISVVPNGLRVLPFVDTSLCSVLHQSQVCNVQAEPPLLKSWIQVLGLPRIHRCMCLEYSILPAFLGETPAGYHNHNVLPRETPVGRTSHHIPCQPETVATRDQGGCDNECFTCCITSYKPTGKLCYTCNTVPTQDGNPSCCSRTIRRTRLKPVLTDLRLDHRIEADTFV